MVVVTVPLPSLLPSGASAVVGADGTMSTLPSLEEMFDIDFDVEDDICVDGTMRTGTWMGVNDAFPFAVDEDACLGETDMEITG